MEENVFLIDVDYSIMNNKPVIILYGRNEKEKSVVVLDNSFKPYFYVIPKSNIKKLKKKIERLQFQDHEDLIQVRKVEIVERRLGLEKKEVLKVYGFLPQNIPKIKDVVKEWEDVEGKMEFDIPFFKRYLLDKQISPLTWIKVNGEEVKSDFDVDLTIQSKKIESLEKKGPKVKILAFDLEAMANEGTAISKRGSGQKIILASVKTNTGLNKVLTYAKDDFRHSIHLKNEKELIEKLIEIVNKEDPDFIVTYNGDGFDLPLLMERAEEYKIKLILGRDGKTIKFQQKGIISAAVSKGRVHIDLYRFIARIVGPSLQSEVLTLDNVANELLGERKYEMSWEDLKKYWKEKRKLDKIAEYCLKDSDLTLKLAEQLLPNIFALSKVTRQIPFDVSRLSYGQLVEGYLMRKAVTQKVLIPNRPTREKVSQRRLQMPYEGAYVIEPKPGIYKDIVYLDYRSLYPSIISSFNIDPSTFDCDCCKEGYKIEGREYHFCKKRKGFISKNVGELLKKRIDVKNEMKKLKKGSQEYRGLDTFQYALKIILNATYGSLGYAGARWYQRESAESTAAKARHFIKKVADAAEKEGFNVIYGDTDSILLQTTKNAKQESERFLNKINEKLPGLMELELEGIYPRGLFITAKGEERGAKKRYALINKEGKLTIRGFEKVRRDWSKLAKEMQEKVLRFVLTDKKEEAVKTVKKTIKNLKEGKVDLKELIIYTQLTKSLESYEQIGPHVAAAKRGLARGMQIRPGDTIPYVITKGKGRISDKSEIYQFAKNYDFDYYVNNQIIPASLRVLGVLGITEDDLLGKSKQIGLKKFTK